MRVMSKGEHPKWRCVGCGRVQQVLYRQYGSWPPPKMKDACISEDECKDFYTRLKGMGVTGIEAEAKSMISHYHLVEQEWAEGGSYLPLSVWATQGYDADSIEQIDLRRGSRSCSTTYHGRLRHGRARHARASQISISTCFRLW